MNFSHSASVSWHVNPAASWVTEGMHGKGKAGIGGKSYERETTLEVKQYSFTVYRQADVLRCLA